MTNQTNGEKALDEIHGASRLARNVAHELHRIAQALHIAGNDSLSERLFWIAARSEEAAERASGGAGLMVSDALEQATSATNNMMAATLAALAPPHR